GHLSLDPRGGQAVTGGVVSYDLDLPELFGAYVFGDFVMGRIWVLYPDAESPVPLLQVTPGLTSLAHGAHGELLVAFISGPVATIVPISGNPYRRRRTSSYNAMSSICNERMKLLVRAMVSGIPRSPELTATEHS